jgi:outer membrane immunogenic protein
MFELRRGLAGLALLGSVSAPMTTAAMAQGASNWTGPHIGIGVAASSASVTHANADDRVNYFAGYVDGGKGTSLTGVVGYDFRIAPTAVVGIFADYDAKGSRVEWHDFGAGSPLTGRFNQSGTWSIGGRLGLLVTPSTLLYATGGWSRTNFDQVDLLFQFGAGGVPGGVANRQIPSQRFSGAFVGGGIESQLGAGASLRLEYRYSDYGENVVDRINPTTGVYSTQVKSDIGTQSIRAVLSYKLGRDAPAPEPMK